VPLVGDQDVVEDRTSEDHEHTRVRIWALTRADAGRA
jgi:hypothetical protein